MQPWDTLVSIDGVAVRTTDDFRDIMSNYAANDTVDMVVIHQNGTRETLQATFGDKHQYYLGLGWSEEVLANLEVEPGDPFLGVEGLSDGTAGIDRLAGPLSPRFRRRRWPNGRFPCRFTSSPSSDPVRTWRRRHSSRLRRR